MVTSGSEMITLQFGSLSNRVAVHYWHMQLSELATASSTRDANILFDEFSKEFRPRAIFMDREGSVNLRSLSKWPRPIPRNICWDGGVDTVYREINLSTNEPVPSTWSECLASSELHAWLDNGLFCGVNNDFYNVSSVRDTQQKRLSCFTEVLDLLSSGKPHADVLEDRLRQLTERCSYLGEIQLVVDAEDGFVGAASRLLEYIAEELPKRPVLTIPIFDTSLVLQFNSVHQQIAKMNELFLLLLLEPDSDNYYRGSWIPLDLTKIAVAGNPCFSAAALAAAWTTVTSPLWSVDHLSYHMDDFVSKSQFGHSRRLLTSRAGFAGETDDSLTWYSLSPYAPLGDQCGSSFWRQLFLRGLPSEPAKNDLVLQLTPHSSDKPDCVLNGSEHNTSFFPLLKPGANLEVTSLSPLPLTVKSDQIYPHTRCRQPPAIRLANVIDAPGDTSAEARSFERIVQSANHVVRYLPTVGIERDLWVEYVEAARTRLLDAYSYDSNT